MLLVKIMHSSCSVSQHGGFVVNTLFNWFIFWYTDLFLNYRYVPNVFGQIVLGKQCRPRLEEQSHQGLHCLPFPLHLLDTLLYSKATCYAPDYEEVGGAYCFRVVCPSVMLSDAWHILWTVHARFFQISYMDSSWKKWLTRIFFLSDLCPFLELCPFEKIRMKSCQQDISKSIWARGL